MYYLPDRTTFKIRNQSISIVYNICGRLIVSEKRQLTTGVLATWAALTIECPTSHM